MNAFGLHRKKEENAGADPERKRPRTTTHSTVDFKLTEFRALWNVDDAWPSVRSAETEPSLIRYGATTPKTRLILIWKSYPDT